MPRQYQATLLLTLTLISAAVRPGSADECPALLRKPSRPEQAEAQARRLMKLMTTEERFSFIRGTGFGITAIPRLGIPALRFDDASAGLRIRTGPDAVGKSTAFPCTLLLAATWDKSLAKDYGQAVAEEFRAAGTHFILGPGMNIYRSANNGRNFEYLGEDPHLAAQMVASYVHGAQGINVATTLKHFVCNETETYRRATDALVDERALHEIYLPPFKAGVDAGAWGVMTSYNLVNGEWAGQSKFVVTDLLRNGLGFKYLVMTDWTSTWHGDRLAQAGTDLEMPKGAALKFDREKVLGTSDVDRMVVNILKTGIASGLYELEARGEYKKPDWASKMPAHEEFALEVNRAGIVLLKNTGILPLESSAGGTILVTGNAAKLQELSGGGSGHVKGYNLTTYLQAAQRGFGESQAVYSENPTDGEIRSAAAVLIFSGWKQEGKLMHEGEGSNHPFQLPEDAFIAHCAELNPRTVVTLACAGGVQMDWAEKAAGIVLAFYGGQKGPEAWLEVVTGKVNPSGKLPFTIERREEDSCAAGEDQLIKPGRMIVNPKELAARVEEKQRGNLLHNQEMTELYTRDLEYKEGIFVGYRWYDSKNIEPRFPFGFGLSYTRYSYSELQVSSGKTGGKPFALVRFKVTNTGKRAGEEVAQVYVQDSKAGAPRPKRELKGFARVRLAAGESKEVTIPLEAGAFSFWHPEKKKWVVEPGSFLIELAASSRDIKASKELTF